LKSRSEMRCGAGGSHGSDRHCRDHRGGRVDRSTGLAVFAAVRTDRDASFGSTWTRLGGHLRSMFVTALDNAQDAAASEPERTAAGLTVHRPDLDIRRRSYRVRSNCLGMQGRDQSLSRVSTRRVHRRGRTRWGMSRSLRLRGGPQRPACGTS
jgi:hypothetical protein